ncbi:hypothetical protein GCM10010403_01980 [Glycomyces rutgersensis]|uniref:Uncharacterized protein n=1 Tax=Glycomyces rutgersensis TaxID=58115 RepID=A0ABN3F602_9ACTN
MLNKDRGSLKIVARPGTGRGRAGNGTANRGEGAAWRSEGRDGRPDRPECARRSIEHVHFGFDGTRASEVRAAPCAERRISNSSMPRSMSPCQRGAARCVCGAAHLETA